MTSSKINPTISDFLKPRCQWCQWCQRIKILSYNFRRFEITVSRCHFCNWVRASKYYSELKRFAAFEIKILVGGADGRPKKLIKCSAFFKYQTDDITFLFFRSVQVDKKCSTAL
eukprot:Lithocolla_globosa_v1_NODE_2720_length_1892_cov_9.936854.p1 type:complete len:114 gc:universal NODE_2720_length_1892_cov_9.936854:1075-1416(+)